MSRNSDFDALKITKFKIEYFINLKKSNLCHFTFDYPHSYKLDMGHTPCLFIAGEDNPKMWLHMDETEMERLSSTIKDQNLKLTLAFGIGLHHAGLVERDRRTVEELFINQKIQVRFVKRNSHYFKAIYNILIFLCKLVKHHSLRISILISK